MKKILTLIVVTLIALIAKAQKDVTKFLGIPVDGTKAEMIQKLKAKGFTSTSYDRDILEGEFNGKNVNLSVVTNGRKVYRIMVEDATLSNESDIKIRFNTLCRQFERNKRYTSFAPGDQTIPEDEDISYQIGINSKRYEAVYYQMPEFMISPEKKDTAYIQQLFKERLLTKFTPEELENPTEEVNTEINKMSFDFAFELTISKSVWFMISEEGYRKYKILMYYDNEYNHADGEDL